MSLCILALRPTTIHPSPSRQAQRPEGDLEVREMGLLSGILLPVLLSFPHGPPGCVVVVSSLSQLWEGAGALETAGIFTHPKRQNWIDRSLKSPQERSGAERGGEGRGEGRGGEERRGGGWGGSHSQEYIRLFPLARGAVTQLLLSAFSNDDYFLPRIFQLFFFTSRI